MGLGWRTLCSVLMPVTFALCLASRPRLHPLLNESESLDRMSLDVPDSTPD